ncbi:MAG: hypothetical protein ACRDZ3_20870 [Acidimicrobiia bacterium]
MPVGTGSEILRTIPAQPFVPDPNAFFQQTSKTILTPRVPPIPGPGAPVSLQLLQAGIVSKLQITFVGSLVVSTADATTIASTWPYGLLNRFRLSANGQNDLFSCDGVDLHVLRYLLFPAFVNFVDDFPGEVGAAGTVAVGTHPLYLTWDVGVAADQTSLIGALYAQSSATNLTAELTRPATRTCSPPPPPTWPSPGRSTSRRPSSRSPSTPKASSSPPTCPACMGSRPSTTPSRRWGRPAFR